MRYESIPLPYRAPLSRGLEVIWCEQWQYILPEVARVTCSSVISCHKETEDRGKTVPISHLNHHSGTPLFPKRTRARKIFFWSPIFKCPNIDLTILGLRRRTLCRVRRLG